MRLYFMLLALALVGCAPGGPSEPAVSTESGVSEAPLRRANPDVDFDQQVDLVEASLNPFENDLRALEVGLRLKDEFRLVSGGAQFEFAARMANGTEPFNETFVLEETSGIDSPTLGDAQREGFYVRTFKLQEADKPRMASADTTLKRLKAESTGGNELTFNAVALTCVDPTFVAPDTYSLTVFVRTHPDVDFMLLGDEMVADREETGALAALFSPCKTVD